LINWFHRPNDDPDLVQVDSDSDDDDNEDSAAATSDSDSSSSSSSSNDATTSPHFPVPAADAPPQPSPSPPPHEVPTGLYRAKNLICPQCRDAVDRAHFRIFSLSNIVLLLRQAESDGLIDGAGSVAAEPEDEKEKEKSKKERPLPGLEESDTTWGGLFTSEEREAEKKKRRDEGVMRDREDRVSRCFDCNWEIDEETGVCEGW
jgi:hypothetical protein